MKRLSASKNQIMMYILIVLTLVLVTISGVYFKQPLIKRVPLYISLIVMLLQSNANRYTFLLGAVNSLLYAYVDFSYGLYLSAISDVFCSSLLQFISFFNWRRRAYGHSTIFRKLTARQIVILAGSCMIIWVVLFMLFSMLGSSYLLLDNTRFIIGLITTVLSMLAFVDYAYLSIINSMLSIVLYIRMIPEHPEQVTYLIYMVYALICIFKALLRMKKLYCEQQKLNYNNEKGVLA